MSIHTIIVEMLAPVIVAAKRETEDLDEFHLYRTAPSSGDCYKCEMKQEVKLLLSEKWRELKRFFKKKK